MRYTLASLAALLLTLPNRALPATIDSSRAIDEHDQISGTVNIFAPEISATKVVVKPGQYEMLLRAHDSSLVDLQQAAIDAATSSDDTVHLFDQSTLNVHGGRIYSRGSAVVRLFDSSSLNVFDAHIGQIP